MSSRSSGAKSGTQRSSRTAGEESMSASSQPVSTHSRVWSDWIGFLCFATLAGNILIHSPKVGLLLLPTILHEMVTAVSFMIRQPLRHRVGGLMPRGAAYVGTFLIPGFLEFARRARPEWIAVSDHTVVLRIAFLLWFAGSVLGVCAVWQLRSSFSIEPQARRLIIRGPYRLARHPIYAAYVMQYVGMALAMWSAPFAVAVGAWFVAASLRIHFEEKVLGAAFPEYAVYKHQVGMLGPRLRTISSVKQTLGRVCTHISPAFGAETKPYEFRRHGEQ